MSRPVVRPTTLDGALVYTGGYQVDADGAPNAYHPDGQPGLDYLANAGSPGDWYGVVTGDGKRTGTPFLQGPGDPSPGHYVSCTALSDRTLPRSDPHRYVDSVRVPYGSIAGDLNHQPAELGDVGCALRVVGGAPLLVGLVCAEVGPRKKYGEGSIAGAEALYLPRWRSGEPCRKRGIDSGVAWIWFPGTSRPWSAAPKDGCWSPALEFQALALARLEAWGGAARLAALLQ